MVLMLALITIAACLWLLLSSAFPRTALSAAVLMVTLAGCGPQYIWVKPGATSANWNVDWTDCRVDGQCGVGGEWRLGRGDTAGSTKRFEPHGPLPAGRACRPGGGQRTGPWGQLCRPVGGP